MFTTALAAKERPGRFFRVTLAVSIGVHVVGAAALTIASFWKIARLSPKAQELVFQPLAAPSAAPAEPPGAPAAPERHEVHPRPSTTAPRDPAHPPAVPAEPTAPGAPSDTAGAGDPEALGTGTGGTSGTVGSAVGLPDLGGAPVDIPPAPVAPAPPQMVDRQEIEGQRIAGDPQIRLPDDLVASLSGQGVTALTVRVRLCIDEAGAPESVRFTPPSGYERVDETLRAQLSTWRYRPWLVNGQPMRVCFPVMFKYRLTP